MALTEQVYEYEVFSRADGKHDWRIRAANGNIVATSGNQGYENKQDCLQSLSNLISNLQAGRFKEKKPEVA